MRRIAGVLVAGFIVFSSGMAFGDNGNDGNALLSKCTIYVNYLDMPSQNISDAVAGTKAGFCLGMMQGMTNLNKIYEVWLDKKALFCLPESGITNGEAARTVVKYLKNHPEKLHETDFILAFHALREVYPCK